MSESGKNSHLLLFTLSAITFMLGFQSGGFQLALLKSTTELDLGVAGMGLPVAAQFFAISFMPLIFGPVSDRVGKKIIIAVFIVLFAVGSIVTWLSGSALEFVIGVFVIGMGYGVCEASVVASSYDGFPGNEEKYINIVQSFYCVGAISSPIILQALMDSFSASWRIIFLISAIAMASLLPAVFFTHMGGPASKLKPKPKSESKSGTKPAPVSLLLGFIVCIFLYVGIESGLAFFADAVFTLKLKAPAFGALAISLFWAGMGIGRVFVGRLKRIPPNTTALFMLSLTAIILAIALCDHEIAMLVLFAVSGFGCSCVWPGINNAAISLDSDASGRIMSFMILGSGLGGAVLPLIMGVVIDAAGMSATFILLAGASCFGGLFMWFNTKKANAMLTKR